MNHNIDEKDFFMVKYDYIIKVIEDYVVKCPTLSDIRIRLNAMSQEEKYDQLKSNFLLNEGEFKDYDYIRRVLDFQSIKLEEEKQNLEDLENDVKKPLFSKEEDTDLAKRVIEDIERTLKDYDSLAFKYERRLFDGTKGREPIVMDYDDSSYVMESQEYSGKDVYDNAIGEIEQAQIKHQQQTLKLSEDEINSFISYYDLGAGDINSYLYKSSKWNRLTDNEKKERKKTNEKKMRNISNAIARSDGLLQDTVLFHGGKFDLSKMVGDEITLKGYTSCSFQENVAKHSIKQQDGVFKEELMYTYRILAPKGTKGICANDDSQGTLSRFTFENEYLLDKGFTGKVVDIDYDKQVVTIMAE